MGVLRIEGSLTAGPPSVTSEAFPGASVAVPLRLRENTLAFNVATGMLSRSLASALAFVPLQGVGPGDAVTKAVFLYLKGNALFDVRLTTDDGLGGSVVSVVPVNGFALLQFDGTKFLKLLEAKGTALIEYFLCGAE